MLKPKHVWPSLCKNYQSFQVSVAEGNNIKKIKFIVTGDSEQELELVCSLESGDEVNCCTYSLNSIGLGICLSSIFTVG